MFGCGENMLPQLKLKKNEERRLLAGHVWIYSNEIDVAKTALKNFQPGDLVAVETQAGKKLGIAYVNPNTLLCARLLTRDSACVIDKNFFLHQLERALALRQICFSAPYYRLVFGESDGLPGLVIDRYEQIFVVQITTAGMEKLKTLVLDALIELFQPAGIVWRNDTSARKLEQLPLYVEVAYGKVPDLVTLEENKVKFVTSVTEGQKTGWFYDQRANRARLPQYVKEKRILDIFSYIGGWGIQAAVLGAREVVCLDASEKAIALIHENAKLNKVTDKISVVPQDAFVALKEMATTGKEKYAVIILDPPAFIKRMKDQKEGTIAYQRIHELALRLLQPGGLLFTTSCSMHLSREQLLTVVRRAYETHHRPARIIEQLHQAQDHPIHPAIKETEYLKGFLIVG